MCLIIFLLLLIIAFYAKAQSTPQLQLTFCSATRSSFQTWYYNSTYNLLQLASNGNCIDILEYGTTVGSLPYTAPCHVTDKDPTHQNQEFKQVSYSSPGNPIIEIMSGLSLDACGSEGVVNGALLTLCPIIGAGNYYINVTSSDNNGTGSLIHTESGLCVDAGESAVTTIPIHLGICSDAPVLALRQIFSLNVNGTEAIALTTEIEDSEYLCLTAPLSPAHNGSVTGSTCAPSGTSTPPEQTFTFDKASGLLQSAFDSLVVDAGSIEPFYAGASIGLSTSSSFSNFIFNETSTGVGRFVHQSSGLCLTVGGIPLSHGCLDRSVRSLPFCDPTLSVEARVADLVSRMTLAEKIGLTGADLTKDNACDTKDPGVTRLGIPPMQWLVETNSMAASACYNGTCATSFPSAQNLAASFNKTVWRSKGHVIGSEMRALNNLDWKRADGDTGSMQSLSGFGPDINQPRDPRNGRQGELPTEDRFLMSRYAVEVVQGSQDSGTKYLQMSSGLKHYIGYSLESGRMGSKGDFTIFDLWDTYIPPFEAGFVEGNASGSMCSYISLHIGPNQTGSTYIPACANVYFLQTLVREYWGRPDATHTSDCGAVENMYKENHYVSNATLAAAAFINAGADLNSEYTVPSELPAAVQLGLVNESTIDTAISRTLGHRFQLGLLDPLEIQPFSFFSSGQESLSKPSSLQLIQDATAQGIVLVKNNDNTLPFKKGIKIAIVGPLGNCQDCLMGDYYADQVCSQGGFGCLPTLSSSITAVNIGGTVNTVLGVTIQGNDTSWSDAIAAVLAADAIVLALGTDSSVGHEGTDLTNIGLPGIQSEFGKAVLAAAGTKPLVLVLVSIFPTAFDELVSSSAILLAYAPTFGAPAIASSLFGDMNRFGRAPMTIYPLKYQDTVWIYDFGIVPSIINSGRTYRYYTGSAGAPLVTFGQGISYSTFSVSCSGGFDIPGEDSITITCSVQILSGPSGDNVLMAFHRASNDIIGRIGSSHPIPLSSLAGFERVSVTSGGESVQVKIELLASKALTLVDETGASVLYPGLHFIDVWDGSPSNNITIPIEVPGSVRRIVKRPPLM
jgi:xylan 1,4-beta-xylosidase